MRKVYVVKDNHDGLHGVAFSNKKAVYEYITNNCLNNGNGYDVGRSTIYMGYDSIKCEGIESNLTYQTFLKIFKRSSLAQISCTDKSGEFYSSDLSLNVEEIYVHTKYTHR